MANFVIVKLVVNDRRISNCKNAQKGSHNVSCDLSDLYLCLIQIFMIYVTELVGLVNMLYDCFQAY